MNRIFRVFPFAAFILCLQLSLQGIPAEVSLRCLFPLSLSETDISSPKLTVSTAPLETSLLSKAPKTARQPPIVSLDDRVPNRHKKVTVPLSSIQRITVVGARSNDGDPISSTTAILASPSQAEQLLAQLARPLSCGAAASAEGFCRGRKQSASLLLWVLSQPIVKRAEGGNGKRAASLNRDGREQGGRSTPPTISTSIMDARQFDPKFELAYGTWSDEAQALRDFVKECSAFSDEVPLQQQQQQHNVVILFCVADSSFPAMSQQGVS